MLAPMTAPKGPAMRRMLQIALFSAALFAAGAAPAQHAGHSDFIRVQASMDSASISIAQTMLNEAIAYEDEGKLGLAAGRYLDLLGLEGDAIAPYQAIGAVRLCGALGKMNRISEARQYCLRASRWPGVPEHIHELAQKLLMKLPER